MAKRARDKKDRKTKKVKSPPADDLRGRLDESGKIRASAVKKKVYEKDIARLHVELIKLQEWIKAPVVLPALRPPPPGGGRDDPVRSQLVQPGRGPYDDLTPEPIQLPPRQKDKGYIRPPMGDQNFVPEKY